MKKPIVRLIILSGLIPFNFSYAANPIADARIAAIPQPPTMSPAPKIPARIPARRLSKAEIQRFKIRFPRCCGKGVTIWGTNGNDIIVGTNGNDVIWAGGGNDDVYGRGGNDAPSAAVEVMIVFWEKQVLTEFMVSLDMIALKVVMATIK